MINHKKLIFFALLTLLIVDRVITLIHFGFQYTDIDQVVQWEGALDYANGVFREPFFYGQNYNYMIESLLAVPLIWLDVPVHMALPITTSWLTIFPFVILAIFFFKRKAIFWAYLCLVLPIALPLEFNMLTTMPRGFIQASLFLPLLFFAVFDPEKRRSVSLFYVGAAFCFLANPSSVIISFPIGAYLLTHHYNSISFYLKSLITVPFLFVLWLSKEYYEAHPEKLIHSMDGVDLKFGSIVDMISRPYLFEFLFPVFPKIGLIYPWVFIVLAIWFFKKRGPKKELIFIVTSLVGLLLSFSVPKVFFGVDTSLVFHSHSRLFVNLPLIFILVLYFVFHVRKDNHSDKKRFTIWSSALIGCVLVLFSIKNFNVKGKTAQIAKKTTFPIEIVSELTTKVEYIDSIAKKHDVQVMVTRSIMGWQFAFKSFAYRTIMKTKLGYEPKMKAIYNVDDRRTWLYNEVENSERVMLYVCFIDEELIEEFNIEPVGFGLGLIKNNTLPLSELFARLKLDYGVN